MESLDIRQLKENLIVKYRFPINRSTPFPPLILRIRKIEDINGEEVINYILRDANHIYDTIAATYNYRNIIKVNSI